MNAHSPVRGHITYHDVEQGSQAWFDMRCGILTASEMKLLLGAEGGGTVTKYRATGKRPTRSTAKREQALAAIADRLGTMRELAFVADVSEGVLRDLVTDGAIEAVITEVPRTYRAVTDDRERAHLYELLAQRVHHHVEPHFESFDMERGKFDEEHARAKYSEAYDEVTECGFVTNDKWGFTIGYSPDGLVGEDGLIECKSRIQKWQMRTLIECVAKNEIPDDFIIQVQTGLLVSERKWLDFVSYSGGMLMGVVRCWPDPEIQEAIIAAATAFEARIAAARQVYDNLIASDARLIPTERLIQL